MMNTTPSPLTKLFVYPVRGMLMGPLISSCPTEKARYFDALKLMTGLLGKLHLTQCWGTNYFRQRNYQETACSRIDVLEWYIEIANAMNLSLVKITLFPMAIDNGSLTVCTSVCNMWSSYIDRLKAEANKGKKKKWVNPSYIGEVFIHYPLSHDQLFEWW
jgi:hypothetical protein